MVREYRDIKKETVVKNLETVLEKKDSHLIGKQLYRILTLYCGFSAHYSLDGFREDFEDLRELLKALLDHNLSPRYFLDNRNSYLYDTAYNGVLVAEIVRPIIRIAEKHRPEVEAHFALREREKAHRMIIALIERYGAPTTVKTTIQTTGEG